MPILRLNAMDDGVRLHGSAASASSALGSAAQGNGPIIIMIHGYKYDPATHAHNPHGRIFASRRCPDRPDDILWPQHLGFGWGNPNEGLAIAYAWRARGDLWRAQRRAHAAGRHLAHVIQCLHRRAPRRAVHILTHSLGSEVAFEALHDVPPGAVSRLITLTGASYRARAEAALRSPAGRRAEWINVLSRENDLYDALFEFLVRSNTPRDCTIGQGVDLPNAVNLQIDCPRSLAALSVLGTNLAGPARRICHWSGYTRPGALGLYSRLMRAPETLPLHRLQVLLPKTPTARWSRLGLRQIAGPSLQPSGKPA